MRLDPAIVRQQIENLRLQYPELAEDEILRADMIEGETDAFAFLSRCVRWIGEEAAFRDGIGGYVADLKERCERSERRSEAFRTLALKVMEAADIKTARLPEATLSLRAGNAKVILTDERAIPAEYMRATYAPDKTAIKEALESGATVEGAILSNGGQSLSIRIK